jgi:hypothetical protein
MRLWMIRMAVVLVVVSIAAPFSAATSVYAASCTGSGCNKKDPVASGCNDPVRKGSDRAFTVTLYSFYSASCNATWSLLTSENNYEALYAAQETSPGVVVDASRSCRDCNEQRSYAWGRGSQVRGYGTLKSYGDPGVAVRTAFW